MNPHAKLLQRVREIALDLELSDPSRLTAERLRAAMLERLAHALAEYDSGCDDEARGEAFERDLAEARVEW